MANGNKELQQQIGSKILTRIHCSALAGRTATPETSAGNYTTNHKVLKKESRHVWPMVVRRTVKMQPKQTVDWPLTDR